MPGSLVSILHGGFAVLLIGLMAALWNTQARAQAASQETNTEYEQLSQHHVELELQER
jgi:hypothetical protein